MSQLPLILLVEDNPDNRLLVTVILEEKLPGGRGGVGRGGAGAACRCCDPAVLLIDITLPGMDGVELLAEIRRRPEVFAAAAGDRLHRPRHGRRPRTVPGPRLRRLTSPSRSFRKSRCSTRCGACWAEHEPPPAGLGGVLSSLAGAFGTTGRKATRPAGRVSRRQRPAPSVLLRSFVVSAPSGCAE